MIKLLDQECIRKQTALCVNRNLKLKFKHDASSLDIADIEIKAEKVSFIGKTHIFSHIIETTNKVFFVFNHK